jgi:Ca-activated chloride channel family protein
MKFPYAIGGSFAGLLMTLIMTPAATVAAAPAEEHASANVYKSGVSVVSLGVTVTDNQQNALRGLGKQDFAVYEDGRPQDVRYFAAEPTPLDLAILLDTSASMGGTFFEVREAAMQLARALRPGDRASFTEVKRGMRDLQPLSSDTSGLAAAMRRTTPGGSTAIYDAIYIALRTLNHAASTTEVRRQALVVLSDGDDTASLLGYDEVLDAARRNGVTIYAVSLRFRPVDPRTIGYDPRHVHGDQVLRQLAQQTGGQAFFSPGRNKLGEACRRIASELASQYSLGYVSDNPRVDARFRQVSVRVVSGNSGKSVQARTRQGYFATAEHQPGLQVPRVGPQGESTPGGSASAPRAMPVKFEMPAGPPSGTMPATMSATVPATGPGTVAVPKWSTHEITLTATNRYESPYVSVDLLGVFSGPNGASAIVNGFWDGGQTFRIRFTPTVEGTWSYATVSDDPGLDAQAGFINCVKADAGAHGFVRYASGASTTSGAPETWTYDDGTAVAGEVTTTVGVRARVARCGGDGDPCGASIGPGRDFIDVAMLQAADARVKEALGSGRVVDICLFDAGDAVTTGEARTYRYIEYMTARYGAYARVVWGLRPAAPADDTQAFWRAARSLLTSADPYFLDGEHVRVSREVCSAAPRSTSSQMAVD